MIVCVFSCGRSGTNMVLEVLSGCPDLNVSKKVEDKSFFARNSTYADYYLTKCDPVYCNKKQIASTMELNPDLHIVWPIRDCRDMILSKIYRGQPQSRGGDGKCMSDDATPEGSVANIQRMYRLYRYVLKHWPDRVMLVKMEDVIEDPQKMSKELCKFLGVSYSPEMPDFVSRMRTGAKRRRYKTVDKGEIAKWKNWKTIYKGFFRKNAYNVPGLFAQVKDINQYFGYQ